MKINLFIASILLAVASSSMAAAESPSDIDGRVCPGTEPLDDGQIVLTIASGVEMVCDAASLRTNSPACETIIDDYFVAGDPLDGKICLGGICAGCNKGSDMEDDGENNGAYLECWACAGESCVSATCTENGGWHCCWDC